MRIMQQENAFPKMTFPGYPEDEVDCPARWIWYPQATAGTAQVILFRLRFSVDDAEPLNLHVSADQRYELFLDGERVGRGPGRSDLNHWFYESYALDLAPGEHLLAARVWWLPEDGAPMAQISGLPGFVVLAEGQGASAAMIGETISTGSGAWECCRVDAYHRAPTTVHGYHVVGWSFVFDAHRFPWGWEVDPGSEASWVPAEVGALPVGRDSNPWFDSNYARRHVREPHLMPDPLPAMLEERRRTGTVRHVTRCCHGRDLTSAPADPFYHDAVLSEFWQALVDGDSAITVEPGQCVRVIVDLDDYYCAYPELVVSGGLGARISLGWAESLFESEDFRAPGKGNRDQVEGKWFHGPHDQFCLDGGLSRRLDTLWWRSGRYLQLWVDVGDEPLTIESLAIRETRYPIEHVGSWMSDNPRMDAVVPVMVRGLQMCSHETYMDCPYYEQLMYAGDTRLEVLATYLASDDSRLPELALRMFDWSRAPDGLTKSRYPSALPQVIPPFSLWWVGMVWDHFLWRDNPVLTLELLPGVGAVLAAFENALGDDGLVQGMMGWNFVDWVPQWDAGCPPGAKEGANCAINLQFLLALQFAAAMFRRHGQPHRAEHWHLVADRLSDAILAAFWDDERGLLADDLDHAHWSEHPQALAILAGLVDGERLERMTQGLLTAPDLARCTIYFAHYLLEALRAVGQSDAFYRRMEEWYTLPEEGFKTTREKPEPSRSDCHAWGAHPLYHYYASVLGARPAEPGFRSVRITPMPGDLGRIAGRLPHPGGMVAFDLAFDLAFDGGECHGTVSLPEGVTGVFVWQGEETVLGEGETRV